MSLFKFNLSSIDIIFTLTDEKERPTVDALIAKDKREFLSLYLDGETVSGKIIIRIKTDEKKLEHQGIKIEFIGDIEFFNEKRRHNEFVCITHQLTGPGEIRQIEKYDFEFRNVEKPFESYTGSSVRLRYFIRVTILRKVMNIVREKNIWVHSYKMPPEINSSIKMEVGIEDCLHLEFEYDKSKYHLKDLVQGKIIFLLVRLKIKCMELSIVRRESIGSGNLLTHATDTMAKFEIMDGCPSKGECIPVRVFLKGFDLSPTFLDINKKFSIRYYLNLVLMDEDGRKYFKQQEVIIFRRAEDDAVLLRQLFDRFSISSASNIKF